MKLAIRMVCLSVLLTPLVADGFEDLCATGGDADIGVQRQVRSLERFRHWLAAVRAHQPGTLDSAALAVGSWSRADLNTLSRWLEAFSDLLPAPGRPRREWRPPGASPADLEALRALADEVSSASGRNDVLKRAALLHADIVIHGTEDGTSFVELSPAQQLGRGRAAGPPARINLRVLDGEPQGMHMAGLHWDLARLALDAVTPVPSEDGMVRHWYRATAAYLLHSGSLADAVVHFQRAQEIFPDDPGVLFDNGCLHETFSSPPVQRLVQTTVLPGNLKIPIGTAGMNLQRAETYFRRALAGDPDFVEARIRLGRVVHLQGRHVEALGELQKSIGTTEDRYLLYYGSLFLGDVLQALDRHAAARDAYRRAAALYPGAQSARLALAQHARRVSDRPAALEAVQQVLALPHPSRGEREDPWWAYEHGAGRNLEDSLTALRKQFLHGSAK